MSTGSYADSPVFAASFSPPSILFFPPKNWKKVECFGVLTEGFLVLGICASSMVGPQMLRIGFWSNAFLSELG